MNNTVNIVVGKQMIDYIKKSKYFKTNLGFASTMESKNGDRILSDKDKFSISYNSVYRSTIYSQGSIGHIHFYLDYYINEPVFAVYYNLEEYIAKFNEKEVSENGIDSFLGLIVKGAEDNYKMVNSIKEESKKEENIKKGNPKAVFTNPGAVSYEDLKAYMEKKRNGSLND